MVFRKSRAVIESASLTAGTRIALSTTVKVPAGISRIVGIFTQSQGGGILELQASSLGESVYIGVSGQPVGTSTGQIEGNYTPCNIPVQPMDEITLYRTAAVDTSSKYEVIVIYFA